MSFKIPDSILLEVNRPYVDLENPFWRNAYNYAGRRKKQHQMYLLEILSLGRGTGKTIKPNMEKEEFTTREAFKELISERGIFSKMGITSGTLRRLRSDVKAGKFPTIDTMEAHLKKCGFKLIQHTTWIK